MDVIQGTERQGMRFRDRNRRGAAAASERTGRGAAVSEVAFAIANAGERQQRARAKPGAVTASTGERPRAATPPLGYGNDHGRE